MEWLGSIPQAVVAAHIVMLPRLHAEERLGEMTAAAIGRTVATGRWLSEQLSEWQTIAGSGKAARVRNRATAEDLRAMGIGVRVAPRG